MWPRHMEYILYQDLMQIDAEKCLITDNNDSSAKSNKYRMQRCRQTFHQSCKESSNQQESNRSLREWDKYDDEEMMQNEIDAYTFTRKESAVLRLVELKENTCMSMVTAMRRCRHLF